MTTKNGHNLPSEGLNWFGKDIQLSPTEDEGLLGVDIEEEVLKKVSSQ
jgi:hypothetical protein